MLPHIATLLFKTEACIHLDHASVACTSRPCEEIDSASWSRQAKIMQVQITQVP